MEVGYATDPVVLTIKQKLKQKKDQTDVSSPLGRKLFAKFDKRAKARSHRWLPDKPNKPKEEEREVEEEDLDDDDDFQENVTLKNIKLGLRVRANPKLWVRPGIGTVVGYHALSGTTSEGDTSDMPMRMHAKVEWDGTRADRQAGHEFQTRCSIGQGGVYHLLIVQTLKDDKPDDPHKSLARLAGEARGEQISEGMLARRQSNITLAVANSTKALQARRRAGNDHANTHVSYLNPKADWVENPAHVKANLIMARSPWELPDKVKPNTRVKLPVIVPVENRKVNKTVSALIHKARFDSDKRMGQLLVRSVGLTEADVQNLGEAISIGNFTNPLPCYVRELNLTDTQLDAKYFEPLADGLMTNHRITDLNLSKNQLQDEGTKILSAAMIFNPKLAVTKLNLTGNQIGPDGMKALVKAMGPINARPTKSLVKKLYLAHNQLGAEGGAHLAKLLSTTELIKYVNVRNCVLGDDAIVEIAKPLASGNKSLTELILSQNNIEHKGIIALAGMLHKNTDLEIIDISSNFWSDRSGHYLIRALKEFNATLQHCYAGQGINESDDLRMTVGFPHNEAASLCQLSEAQISNTVAAQAHLWRNAR
jgi:hypothetical protein